MPSTIFKAAYPNEPPISARVIGIHKIADSIPLRGNSKLLKGTKDNSNTRRESEGAFKTTKEAREPEPSPRARASHARDDTPMPASSARFEPTRDDAEMVLLKEYELKLAKLRAVKTEPIEAQPRNAETSLETTGTIQLRRNPDGSLCLNRSSSPPHPTHEAEARSEVKAEVKPEVKAEVKTEPRDGATSATAAVITVGELDPYAQAAITALDKKTVAKRLAQTEKRKADAATRKAEAKPKAVAASSTIRPKRRLMVKTEAATALAPESKPTPKSAAKDKKKRKLAILREEAARAKNVKAAKKERVKKEQQEIEILSKADVMKAMPKGEDDSHDNPPAVHFKTGCIYTAIKPRRFRALLIRNDKYTERSAAWGKNAADKKAAWAKLVTSIDKHKA